MKYGIVIALVWTIVPIVLAFISHNKNQIQNQKDVFYYPRFFVIMSCLSFALLSILYVGLFWSGQIMNASLPLICGVLIPVTFFLSLGGMYLLLKGLNFRLELKTDAIIYRNCFRKTYIINYLDVLEVISWYFPSDNKKMQQHKIITKVKKIPIEYMAVNYDYFFQTLKNRLRQNKVECKFTIKKGNLRY